MSSIDNPKIKEVTHAYHPPAREFNTGSVGYGLSLRDVQFMGA